MDGEFRVRIKKYDANKLVAAFEEYYGDNLAQAYARSASKAVTSALEAFFGFVMLVVLKVLLTPSKRAFSFKI